MQIVIDIPDNYDLSKIQNGSIASKVILNAVANGTPLPKGHERLVDMKNLQNFVSRYTEYDAIQLILADREDYIPTIIEADKVESEDENCDG